MTSVLQVHHRQQQHVFFLRRGLSFQTQLLCATYHELAKAADEGHTTHAIVMDFKKAFDKKVPHFLLLQKLQGTPGINTTFLTGYLISFLIDTNPLF